MRRVLGVVWVLGFRVGIGVRTTIEPVLVASFPPFGVGVGLPGQSGCSIVRGGSVMSVIIETEVFTIDELSDEARERALEWVERAWSDVYVEHISGEMSEILRDAFGPDSLTWESWDVDRGYVNVSGRVCVSDMDADHWLVKACPMPGGGVVRCVDYRTPRANAYGGSVWVDLSEDAPFGWADDAFGVLVDDMRLWVSGVESELVRVMNVEWDYLSSGEYVYECALVNGYTFTADGRRFG